ncbi:C2 calcium-dependent domain-containing protein 4B-like [Phascolarctos cinereus]|uniref:C2 calcium-dependent domain-containing protein 4A-like n=1 Tax=Phascolarctos cinereus TaxID=38626 RepID=A0A6P5ITF4_PHACI|nr:C2 calcium-dependent domain-containing protein 4A-like [Phascolarctos cinereus]XP_020824333.1 C2 calcium-dependent domain-containing protein 4A-like [Phascolarctos cinereus]
MRFLEKLRDSTGVSTALEPEKAAVDFVSKSPAVSPFCNVLTPGRIPAFCIPPRLPSHAVPAFQPLDSSTSTPRRCTVEPDMWSHSQNSSSSTGQVALRPALVGARKDPDLTDWDPRSQAALSLPHLPRRPTSYGFCALLESPNTRRKESLFLGGSAATAALVLQSPRPRAHTYCGGGGTNASYNPRGQRGMPGGPDTASSSSVSSSPCASPRSRDAPAPCSRSRPRYRRLLQAPDSLFGRALRVSGSRVLARARSVSSAEDDDEDYDAVRDAGRVTLPATCQPDSARARAPSPTPSPSPLGPQQERLEVETTVALDHDGGALHLATKYCPVSRRLRIRLLRAEGLYSRTTEPGAIGCRVSFTLVPPGKTRKQRSAVVRRSRNPVFNEDFFFDGLSEDDLRRTAVRVKAENKGRGLERDRLLGQGELELRSILL